MTPLHLVFHVQLFSKIRHCGTICKSSTRDPFHATRHGRRTNDFHLPQQGHSLSTSTSGNFPFLAAAESMKSTGRALRRTSYQILNLLQLHNISNNPLSSTLLAHEETTKYANYQSNVYILKIALITIARDIDPYDTKKKIKINFIIYFIYYY